MTATLNLVDRLCMVPVINKTDTFSTLEEIDLSTDDVPLSQAEWPWQEILLTIPNPRVAVSDITITIAARARFLQAQPSYVVELYLGSQREHIGTMFRGLQSLCPEEPAVESVTIPLATWNDILAANEAPDNSLTITAASHLYG